MSKSLTFVFILITIIIVILSIFLFAIYLPNVFKDNNDSYNIQYDNHISNIEKHVMFIGKDLSDPFEHQSVMSLKSMFNVYNNIIISIFDSEGNIEKQNTYLERVLDSNTDVVILNSVDFKDNLPSIIELSNNKISVIVIGSHTISPYYISIGYSPIHTGKLLAQRTYEKPILSDISFIIQSPNDRNSADTMKGFSTELKKYSDIHIENILYTSGLTRSEIVSQLDVLLDSKEIVILDTSNFQLLYDMVMAQGYSGTILGVTQSYDHLVYVMDNQSLTFVFQDPEMLNEQLFDILLTVFNNTQENPHYEAQQIIINSDNIEEYINE